MDFGTSPSPGALWRHHKDNDFSSTTAMHEGLPCPASHGSAAAGIASLPACLQSSHQQLWARPCLQAGEERKGKEGADRLQFPAPTQLPELTALDGAKERDSKGKMKTACQESAGERAMRLILMQRVAEKQREPEAGL